MPKTSPNKLKYISEYSKENYQQYIIRINKKYNQDIINHLNSLPNKSGYIMELIRKDISGK